MCLLHIRSRRRLKRREREFWEHPIVAARTLEGAYYTLYRRLREDESKFFNYFRMSTAHETPNTKTNKRASTYLLQRRYKTTSGHTEDECAPALRINPAYLSSGSPASRRHIGGRTDKFVLSAPYTAWS